MMCMEEGLPSPRGCLTVGDRFVPHGSVDELLALCGLMPEQIAKSVRARL